MLFRRKINELSSRSPLLSISEIRRRSISFKRLLKNTKARKRLSESNKPEAQKGRKDWRRRVSPEGDKNYEK